MGRIEVPDDLLQQHAQLRTELNEVARRTVPSTGAINRLSAGCLAYRERQNGQKYPIIGGAAGPGITEVIARNMIPGRLYQVSVRSGVWVDGAGDSTMATWISYTIDGTTPVPSGAILRTGNTLAGGGGSIREVVIDGLLVWPEGYDTLRALFCVYGHAGGRSYGVWSDTGSSRFTTAIWVMDLGTPTSEGTDY